MISKAERSKTKPMAMFAALYLAYKEWSLNRAHERIKSSIEDTMHFAELSSDLEEEILNMEASHREEKAALIELNGHIGLLLAEREKLGIQIKSLQERDVMVRTTGENGEEKSESRSLSFHSPMASRSRSIFRNTLGGSSASPSPSPVSIPPIGTTEVMLEEASGLVAKLWSLGQISSLPHKL